MELEQAKPFHELQKPSKLPANFLPRIPAQVLKTMHGIGTLLSKRQEVQLINPAALYY